MKVVFVIGASRSGSTVMSEALGRLDGVHQCNELHFYNLISPKLGAQAENSNLALLLLEYIDNSNAVLEVKNSFKEFVNLFSSDYRLQTQKYGGLVEYFEKIHSEGSSLIVEQTPMNIFYMDDIQSDFGDTAVFIAMNRM